MELCREHNQPIILQNQDPTQGVFCVTCIEKKTGLIQRDQFKKQIQEIIQNSKQENTLNKQQLESVIIQIQKLQESLSLIFNKIIGLISNAINDISSYTQQLELIIQSINTQSITIEKLTTDCKNQQQKNEYIQNQIIKQYQEIQQALISCSKIEQIFDEWNKQRQKQNFQVLKDIKKIQFEYELVKEASKKEPNQCFAFTFNKQGNILIVACCEVIIVYEFINSIIVKEIQRLTAHNDIVYCLNFMRHSNQFVSGSKDKSIIIWENAINSNQQVQNQWQVKAKLTNHYDDVLCLLVNRNEDLLISSSFDKTIKIWMEKNNQWSLKESIIINSFGYSISLNEQENKLITCGGQPIIQVLELCQKKWNIVQNIQVQQSGNRLSFLVGDKFIYQPLTSEFLLLYHYNNTKKYYEIHKQIKVQSCYNCEWFFQCQFIEKINILSVKHGQYLNIFQVQDDDYKLKQTIEFSDFALYGRLTDDGQYLIIWDNQSKDISIRTLKYQK